MSAEQTPDIERVLAEHTTIATGLGEWCCKCSPRTWRPTVHRARHVAQALAPVLAAVVREAEQRAWDEGYASGAADWDGITLTAREIRQAANPYRADRVAEPQHEAATSGKESEASDE